jgi:hypothetical protein
MKQVLALVVLFGVAYGAPPAQGPTYIPLATKIRPYVSPEKVGLPKDFPAPTVSERIYFRCPTCALRMSTHVVYPYLPRCHKCGTAMPEIETPKCIKPAPK